MSGEADRFTVWYGLLFAEAAALLIGLLMPITRLKTRSDWELADLFSPIRVIYSTLSFTLP